MIIRTGTVRRPRKITFFIYAIEPMARFQMTIKTGVSVLSLESALPYEKFIV